MIRIVFFLILLTALAFGFAWLADQPGTVSLAFAGKTYEMDLVVALGFGLALIVVAMILWSVARFMFRIPTLMSLTARMRRRNKGFAALTRGMVAAGAGDAKTASRAARDAEKLMGGEPLALLLSAQAAQLSGDRAGAERIFGAMMNQPETRLLGLRGLHAEARRRGDDDAAHEFARKAHEIAAVPWAGQAMLERHALSDDWRGALAVVEANLARKAITRAEANRQRAVLKTAIAEQLRARDPAEALALAREAIKLAPDLTPASALAGSLLAHKGDLRRAGRILENAWKRAPHPELARAYVDLRHGDAAGDRLNRAKALARLAPGHAESQFAIARAALEARQFDLARRTMAELMDNGGRPTVRMCLTMADIEETEHGPTGLVREWLARAARAPRDPAWVADGIVSDRWLPASPVTGQIDAFRWETPVERLGGPADDAPPPIWPVADSKTGEVLIHQPLSPETAAAISPPVADLPSGDDKTHAESAEDTGAGPPAAVANGDDAPREEPVPEPLPDSASQPTPPQQAPAPAIAAADAVPQSVEAVEPATLVNEPAIEPLAQEPGHPDVSKPAIPEHIVTAPDDPGPDAASAPTRKRGLFA